MSERFETIVIGAGISGLTFAFGRKAVEDLVVLDERDDPGGLVRTLRSDEGFRFEFGPEAMQSNAPETDALLDELELERRTARKGTMQRYLVKDGRLLALPSSPAQAITTPLLSSAGKLRALTERWRDPRVALDGSVADFIRHRFGRGVLDSFVDPFVSGVYAGDAEELSARAAFPELLRMVEEHGSVMAGMARRRGHSAPALVKPVGGMRALTDRLTERLGDAVRTSTRVLGVERSGGGFAVETDRGTFGAERVVVATSAQAAGRLLARLSPAASATLASVPHESLVSVAHGWSRDRVDHPLDGFGYLVPSRESRLALGTLFSSAIDPDCAPEGHVLLRTLVGGARHPELVERTDDELLAIVQDEAAPLLGLHGRPVWTRILRHRAVLPRYDLGHPERVRSIRRAVGRVEWLEILGNHLDGIGLNPLIRRARELAGAWASRPEAIAPG